MLLFQSFLLSLLVPALCLPQEIPEEAQDEVEAYDYIVIGSGPGGGPLATNLAKANFSVLLIEAGSDESDNVFTEVAALYWAAGAGNTSWGFYVSHYDNEDEDGLATSLRHNLLTWKQPDGELFVGTEPPEGSEMLGVYYPRGATLGGSAITNARCASLASDSDWEEIAELTGEESWR